MARAGEPRVVVRMSSEQRDTLRRFERSSGLAAGALLREVALAYGPVWIANRAAARAAGEPVQKVRRGNGVEAVRSWVR
jgi:hypothetical protein